MIDISRTSLILLGLAAICIGGNGMTTSVDSSISITPPVRVASDLVFPEGPAYDGKDAIYVSNCNSDYITKVSLKGEVSVPYRASAGDEPFTFKKSNGMTFYKDGSLWITDFGRNAILRMLPGGKQELIVDHFEGKPLEGPNDLAFDPVGNLYFTCPNGSDKEHPTGPLYRLDHKTKKLTKVADGMGFPNGLAFTSDAKYLYVCESSFNRMLRYTVQKDGSLKDKTVFCDLSSNGDGAPDGMAIDSMGNLWVAHYGQHSVLIISSEGKITQRIAIPFTKKGDGPTNIEFAGKDLKRVYVTDPGSDALWVFDSSVGGLPLFCAPKNRSKE